MLFQNKSNAAENLDGTTDLTGKKVHIVNADKTSLNAHYGNTATGFFYADNIDGVICCKSSPLQIVGKMLY